MKRLPCMSPFGGIAKRVTRSKSRGGSQTPSSGRRHGRGHASTFQDNYQDLVPVPGTSHTDPAAISPMAKPSMSSTPVYELLRRQGGYGTASEDIDPRIFDATYWPININLVQAPKEYRPLSVDTYVTYI